MMPMKSVLPTHHAAGRRKRMQEGIREAIVVTRTRDAENQRHATWRCRPRRTAVEDSRTTCLTVDRMRARRIMGRLSNGNIVVREGLADNKRVRGVKGY